MASLREERRPPTTQWNDPVTSRSGGDLVFGRQALHRVQHTHHTHHDTTPLDSAAVPRRVNTRSKSGGPAKRFRSVQGAPTSNSAAKRSLTGRSGNVATTLPGINPPSYATPATQPKIQSGGGYAGGGGARRPIRTSAAPGMSGMVPPSYIRSRSRTSALTSTSTRGVDVHEAPQPSPTPTSSARGVQSTLGMSGLKAKERSTPSGSTSARRSRTAELPQVSTHRMKAAAAAGAATTSPLNADITPGAGGVGWTVDRAGMSKGKGNKLQWFGPPGEVVPGLWVGSMEHAAPTYVAQAGFTTIFSIMRYSVFGGPPLYPAEVEFHNYPFCDNGTDVIPFADIALKINESLGRGMRILVHCKQGISRSVSSVMAYLLIFKGMSFDESLSAVKSVRPAAAPKFSSQLRILVVVGRKEDRAAVQEAEGAGEAQGAHAAHTAQLGDSSTHASVANAGPDRALYTHPHAPSGRGAADTTHDTPLSSTSDGFASTLPQGVPISPVDAPPPRSQPHVIEATESHAVLKPVSDYDCHPH